MKTEPAAELTFPTLGSVPCVGRGLVPSFGPAHNKKRSSLPEEFAIELFLFTMSAAPICKDDFVERLRQGDEAAFSELLDSYHGALYRLARSLGATEASAEEIVQETWVAVINGIDRFEGRSSLKTWIFAILTNQARRRTARDARMPPLSALFSDEGVREVLEKQQEATPRGASSRTFAWSINPEDRVAQRALLEVIQRAADQLPVNQRAVLVLRDFEGLASEEVCRVLELSDGNHRVLLHRARNALRVAVSAYYARIDGEVLQ